MKQYNETIKELIKIVKGQSVEQARKSVEKYFDKVIWSVDKEEWSKMTEDQKGRFVQLLVVDSK